MRITGTAPTTFCRLAAVIAVLSIVTCAAMAQAQSTTDDKENKTITKEDPAKTSKPRIRPDIRTRNVVQTGDVMGPPAPGAARKAPAKATPNIPEPTVTLSPGQVPKIEFDTPTYNFGKIRAGADVVHDFWFTNNGSGPLEILAVKPG